MIHPFTTYHFQGKFKEIIFLIIITISFVPLTAQDAIFSQFYANPLYLNPAFAGASANSRLTAGYRNEWPGLKAFNTYNLSYDQPVDALQGGIGILVNNNVMGARNFSNLSIGIIYSYEIILKRRRSIWAGIGAHYAQQRFLASNLKFPSMVDPNGSQIEENINGYYTIYPDFSFGLLSSFNNFFGGFSVQHLTKPTLSNNERLNRKLTVHLGQHIPTNTALYGNKRLSFSPNLLIQLQGITQQINYGMYIDQEPISFGFWLRQDISIGLNTMIFTLGFTEKNYQIGYSYDLYLGSRYINMIKSSAHEVTFLYKFKYTSERKQKGAIKCPKF